jgi:hypothetical protein
VSDNASGPRPARAPLLATVAALALFGPGCSGPGDREPVYPVQGRVLYDGKPAAHALVVFHPVGKKGKDVPRPRAQAGPDGTFKLTTYDADDGAPAGEYAVTVEWWLSTATRKSAEGESAPPLNRLPGRYARAQTSGLRVRIDEAPNQLPAFQLKR